jgi:hypothetical protein
LGTWSKKRTSATLTSVPSSELKTLSEGFVNAHNILSPDTFLTILYRKIKGEILLASSLITEFISSRLTELLCHLLLRTNYFQIGQNSRFMLPNAILKNLKSCKSGLEISQDPRLELIPS